MQIVFNQSFLFISAMAIVIALIYTSFILLFKVKRWSVNLFTVSKIIEAVGVLSVGLRNSIPDLFSIGVGNIVIVVGVALEAYSLVCYKNNHHKRLQLFYTLIIIATAVLFTLFIEHLFIRTMILSLASGTIAFIGGCVLFLNRGNYVYPVLMSCGLILYAIGRFSFTFIYLLNYNTLTLEQYGAALSVTFYMSVLMVVHAISYLLLLRELEQEEMLEESKLINTILEQSPLGILIEDLDQKIEYANPVLCNLAGLSNNELVGNSVTTFEHGIISEQINLKGILAHLEKQRIWKGNIKYENKKGEQSHLEVIFRTITDDNQKPVKRLAFVQDITPRKKAEELIKQQNIELKRTNLGKDKLFSIISHDLKAPVGNVSNFLSYVQNGELKLTAPLLKTMSESMNNIHKLLGDLLLWSRSQKKTLQPYPAPVPVETLVKDGVSYIQLAAEDKEIEINISAVNNKHFMLADKQMVGTILRNLFSNAVKYTRNKGQIKVYSSEFEEQVEISVEDNGVGVPEDLKNKLFGLEATVESRRGTGQEKGTGLGLLICKELADLNGGEIGVESETDLGSRFWVRFPKVKNGKIVDSDKETWKHYLKANEVLYIEDNEAHIIAVEFLLNRIGVNITAEKRDVDGLKKALTGRYKIILLDLELQEIGGVKIAERVKEKFKSEIKIIAVTSFTKKEVESLTKKDVFDGYLQKPFYIEELESVVKRIVRQPTY